MDARLFQEAIRSATVTYPIPFVFGILLLFAVLCFGGSLIGHDWLTVLFAAVGSLSAVSAIGLVGYAVGFKSDLLRSERHEQAIRLIEIVGDKEMDQAARAEFMTALLGNDTKLRGRRGTRMGEHDG